MPIDGMHGSAAAARRPAQRRRFDYGRLVNGSFAVAVFCGAIAFVEPSPYDFATLIAAALWFAGGFRVHPLGLFFSALIFVYNLGGFISLMPHLDESLPTTFMLQSLYLAFSAVFFVLFFAEDSERRAEICLAAFAASTVVAATAGILGYFNIAHAGLVFSMYGRASGTFKDPNVLGSYLIMGALYFLQNILVLKTRRWGWNTLALLVVVLGIFLSFSRGSWLAFTGATTLMIVLSFLTAATMRQRNRILFLSAVVAVVAVAAVLIVLSLPSTRDFFFARAAVAQDYDVGETGRFGNQARSLSMLLDRVNGFGPLRFRLTFGLDPHNSYINAFASYGWLGATAFFLMVGLTVFVGFRLVLVPSPYRRIAQVFWPALLVFLIQGLQIDIDHWRHVYLMLGAVWGLETARVRWLAAQTGERRGARAQAAMVPARVPSTSPA